MVKISNYLKQKGQGIVEYALLLAFIVGIAVALQGVGLKDAVVGVFDDVATVLAGGSNKSNLYAENFSKYSTTKKEQLREMDNTERIDTDLAALENIANFAMGKELSELEKYFKQFETNWENQIQSGNGRVIFENWDNENSGGQLSGHYTSSDGIVSLMYGSSHDLPYYGNTGTGTTSGSHSWVKEKYFYSDAMIGEDKGNNERYVKISVNTDNGVVTGAHVWVTGKNGVDVTTSRGKSLSDVGSNNQSLYEGVKVGTKK